MNDTIKLETKTALETALAVIHGHIMEGLLDMAQKAKEISGRQNIQIRIAACSMHTNKLPTLESIDQLI